LDSSLPDGWFYKEANGFGGAGAAGFSVVDDADASLWTEFQRLGGADWLGYPISQRFVYDGLVTQAFQKSALQWQPDQGQAVLVGIMDDLAAGGLDDWLDQTRQVPATPDGSADIGLSLEDVRASHFALFDAYPALRAFYDTDSTVESTYGLPLSIQDYGGVASTRLQRGILQFWTVDTAWASAGTVTVGNVGDLARDAGLWPLDALVPSVP